MSRYWHGGNAGLRPGDYIEPGHDRTVDGCPICTARAAGENTIDPPTGQPHRVYVTTDREYARFYASMAVLGDLYQVEPVGEVEPSDEDHFPTYVADSARVIAVYERAVRLTGKQRRHMYRRWEKADREVRR